MLNIRWLAVGLVAALTAGRVHGGTVVLPAIADAAIFQNNVNNASGGGNGLFTGTNTSGSPRRSLLRFDMAAGIPSGATIESVELQLTLGQIAGGANVPLFSTVELHRVIAGWTEGEAGALNPPSDSLAGTGQGVPAAPGDVTWNARDYATSGGVLWSSPGGDYLAPSSAGVDVPLTLDAVSTWSSTARLVADAQLWLDSPEENAGWILKSHDEATGATLRGFYSRSVASESLRPRLVVTYAEAPSLTADFDDDGDVDGSDLLILQRAIGTSDIAADATGDGVVDGADLLRYRQEFGQIQETRHAVGVPEISSLSLQCIGLIFVAIGRRQFCSPGID